jgi:hypothetical protein
MLSRLLPLVSGMKNQAQTPPMMVTTAKNQNVPFGDIPPFETARSIGGTARELPY